MKKAVYQKSLVIILFMGLVLVFPSSLLAHKRIRMYRSLNLSIQTGIDKIYRGEYDGALEAFQQIIKKDEESPVGYFYTAAFYEVMMQSFRNRSYEEQFDFYINEAIKKGEKLLWVYKDDEWLYFYLGGSYGYRAIDRTETGNWFGAFSDAVRGATYLEKAIEINPELFDAYYGFGVYKYWRSVKSKVLWFLPFFEDERKTGISDIELAINKGQYSQYEAMGALVSIYRNENNYVKALDLTQAILEKYPDNIHALRMKGILYVDLKKWDEASSVFQELSRKLNESKWQSSISHLEILYYFTFIDFQQQKAESCVQGCMKLLNFKDDMDDYAKSDTMISLRKKINDLCRRKVLVKIRD
jgi:tetratricopeptide (TPR) repeat protein